MAADPIDEWFPRLGPCGICGVPGIDQRHRVIEAIADRVNAGEGEEDVAGDPASTLKDSWKMPGFDPDRHEGACEGVWITPWLLDNYGPLTEM